MIDDGSPTPEPRFVLITEEDALKMIGVTGETLEELAGIMYKKLAQGVEPVELVTLEFDYGRAKLIASRREAALDYIVQMLEDLRRLESPTPEEVRITFENIFTVQSLV